MTALLCRLGFHTRNRYLTIRNNRYCLVCVRCGKELT